MILSLIIGIPLGILSSLVAWWILFHCIVPKLSFCSEISKTRTQDNESGYRYRIKMKNTGSRDIIDVEFFARFRVQGLRKNTPTNWSNIDLKLTKNRIPQIKMKSDRILRVYPEKTDFFGKEFLPEEIQKKYKNNTLTLECIFNMGNASTLQFFVFGYDSFSGTRKVFETKIYTIDDIKRGLFDRKGLQVIAERQPSNNTI